MFGAVWRTNNTSFKKDIWQNVVVKQGLSNFEILENILTPLFSPKIEFIYPLDWAWEEQFLQVGRQFEEESETEEIEEESWEERGVDWEILTGLYQDIFDIILEKGSFSVTSLNNADDELKSKWLSQKENIDMLMMFIISKITLTSEYDLAERVDERLELFRRLCKRDKRFYKLEGKTIASYIDNKKEGLKWNEIYISPYVIYIEGEDENV